MKVILTTYIFSAVLFLETLFCQFAGAQSDSGFPPRIPETKQELKDDDIPVVPPIDPISIPSGTNQIDIAPEIEITIKQFQYKGNTGFTDEEIDAVLEPFLSQTLFVDDLKRVEEAITNLYFNAGYLASGARILPTITDPKNATIELLIIEGESSEIKILGAKRFTSYIQKQLSPLKGKPIRKRQLFNYLRFLLDKPYIKDLSVNILAKESSGKIRLGQNSLEITIELGRIVEGTAFLNNGRSSLVGELERGARVTHQNLVGFGDKLTIDYRNTDGSNLVGVNYDIPITPKDGTISIGAFAGYSKIVEKPFDQFNLETSRQIFSTKFRQPFFRNSNNTKLEEFAISLGLERIESQDKFNGTPFSLTSGANERGKFRSTVLTFGQDYIFRSQKNTIALNSEFRVGLPIETTNNPFFGENNFFVSRSQAQYAHRFQERVLSLTRAKIQLSNSDLTDSEEFILGGAGSIRGIRPASLTGNSGISLTQEAILTAFTNKMHRIQIAPFIDAGYVWNRSNQLLSNNSLVGTVGISIYYNYSDRIRATVDFGYPVLGEFRRRDNIVNFNVQIRF